MLPIATLPFVGTDVGRSRVVSAIVDNLTQKALGSRDNLQSADSYWVA